MLAFRRRLGLPSQFQGRFGLAAALEHADGPLPRTGVAIGCVQAQGLG